MALRLREVGLTLEEEEELLPEKLALQLNIPRADILYCRIVRKGIDARRKSNILRVYTLEFSVAEERELLLQQQANPRLAAVAAEPQIEIHKLPDRPRVLVVGMGPAGLFAALQLSDAGARVTLIEQGKAVSERLRDVTLFQQQRIFNPQSNIQFGEGGAGTFSDGKLTSRLNDPLLRQVLKTLVDFGAPAEILWQAQPHIGSDRLRRVLVNLRTQLLNAGVEIRFSTRLTGLDSAAGRISAGVLDNRDSQECDALVLAPGHSARETYRMLRAANVALEQKAFALGVRVEHPQELINEIQYGMKGHELLPPAEYKLAWNDPETKRGTYSFCMCPGGWVVNAASEEAGLVVNGMSDYSRGSDLANSALIVSVRPADFATRDPLAGIAFQRRWERQAYQLAGGNWDVPAQSLTEFLGQGKGTVRSSCRPGVTESELSGCLPDFVVQGLHRALPVFNQRMRGFISAEATLIGVETRTSSPVRVLRDKGYSSLSHPGLYPAGEGAGYAGGIMSAAIDGLKVAHAITAQHQS